MITNTHNYKYNSKSALIIKLKQSVSLALVRRRDLFLLLLLLLLFFDCITGWSFGRFGNDVQVLVDIDEFVGSFTINVIVPFANSSLLRIDGAVGAEEGLNQSIVITIMPHLSRKPNVSIVM